MKIVPEEVKILSVCIMVDDTVCTNAGGYLQYEVQLLVGSFRAHDESSAPLLSRLGCAFGHVACCGESALANLRCLSQIRIF